MGKLLMLKVIVVLLLAICLGGCNSKSGKEKNNKTNSATPDKRAGSAGAKHNVPATAVDSIAAFAEQYCYGAMNDPSVITERMVSVPFLVRIAMTSEVEKATSREDLDKLIAKSEESIKQSKVNDPDQKAESCKVIEARDVDCDQIYGRIDADGFFGGKSKPAPGRAKEIGDSLNFESCGFFKVSVKAKGYKEITSEWGGTKVDGKYILVTFFNVSGK